jgi:hypothetical protein
MLSRYARSNCKANLVRCLPGLGSALVDIRLNIPDFAHGPTGVHSICGVSRAPCSSSWNSCVHAHEEAMYERSNVIPYGDVMRVSLPYLHRGFLLSKGGARVSSDTYTFQRFMNVCCPDRFPPPDPQQRLPRSPSRLPNPSVVSRHPLVSDTTSKGPKWSLLRTQYQSVLPYFSALSRLVLT